MTRGAFLIPCALMLLAATGARAELRNDTVGIFVGANVGSPDDDPLRYAEQDARRVRATWIELSGLRPERAILVLGGGPGSIRAAFDEARGRAAELTAAGGHVSFVFYYSGHGDETALHLPRGEVQLASLRDEIARIPAVLRLSVLDACRTMGRGKGVRRGPSFEAIALPEAQHGTIELRASSLGEGSQESEELSGAIFSHYFVSGLRGAADADQDGQVTLGEVYTYAYRHTMLRTGGAPGLQHPSMASQLAGAGEVVLSHLQRAAARLGVPAGAERYLLFALPSATVVGEVDGSEGREIALPAGRYLIARRGGGRAAVAEIDLPWGGRRSILAGEFRPISREELQNRGGRLELHPFSLEARAGVELSPGAAEGPGLGVILAAGYVHGLLHLRASVGLATGPLSTWSGAGWTSAIVGRLGIGPRLLLGRITLTPLFGLAARYAWSSLDFLDAERRTAAGLPIGDSFASGQLGPGAELHLSVPLRKRLFLSADVAFDALVRRERDGKAEGSLVFHPLLGCSVGLGAAL